MKADFSILSRPAQASETIIEQWMREERKIEDPKQGLLYKWDGEKFVWTGFIFERPDALD